jgi:diaminohydroxyphosphoribosylaminopyrimidine deaminase/5-amino-6-(5-phosphoribosylamino)uracil reductase
MDGYDERYMALAIEEGYKGKGKTTPNPAVGAVVVNDNVVIGVGYHAKAGQAHAEVNALEQAGANAAGGELYVTLEPCNHGGRTPPCTEAIIEAGISKVVIGALDPNPGVEGGGVEKLRSAGITVESGAMREHCRELCEDFAKYINTGLPFVTAKYAMTLDGKIASPTGDSFWITSEKSRERAHLMRWRNDAVLVGSQTVRKDNPRLTVRLDGYSSEEGPVRVVVSSDGDIPPDSEVLSDTPTPPTWIACTESADTEVRKRLSENGAEVIVLDDYQGRVDLKALMAELGKRGIMGVLAEGGGDLLGAMIDLGLVDKVCAFIAPKVIGGSGKSPVEGQGRELMSEAIELKKTSIERIDNDLLFTGYITDTNDFFPAE